MSSKWRPVVGSSRICSRRSPLAAAILIRCASPPARRRRLAEAQVAETDLVQHLQAPQHFRRAGEEGQRLAHREIEHLVDRAAAVAHFEHLRLEALAVALVARHEDVGEELHLDADFAFALARFAAPARYVEREMARGESARPRVFRRREQLADRIEQIRDRVGARGSADRRLIDEHGVGDVLGALQRAERSDPHPSRPWRA